MFFLLIYIYSMYKLHQYNINSNYIINKVITANYYKHVCMYICTKGILSFCRLSLLYGFSQSLTRSVSYSPLACYPVWFGPHCPAGILAVRPPPPGPSILGRCGFVKVTPGPSFLIWQLWAGEGQTKWDVALHKLAEVGQNLARI